MVAMWDESKGYCPFDVFVLIYLNCKCIFLLLPHPICLCLAMIVYALQGVDDVAGSFGEA